MTTAIEKVAQRVAETMPGCKTGSNPWGVVYEFEPQELADFLRRCFAELSGGQSPSGAPDVVLLELKNACDIAMKNSVVARIPECGEFAAIAQSLSWVISNLESGHLEPGGSHASPSNTGEHYMHAVKTQDADSEASCLECQWCGRRDELVHNANMTGLAPEKG